MTATLMIDLGTCCCGNTRVTQRVILPTGPASMSQPTLEHYPACATGVYTYSNTDCSGSRELKIHGSGCHSLQGGQLVLPDGVQLDQLPSACLADVFVHSGLPNCSPVSSTRQVAWTNSRAAALIHLRSGMGSVTVAEFCVVRFN